MEYIANFEKVSQNHLLKVGRGRNGKTFAHWQIGFAYAQDLSPAFHAWCNDVVRQHMIALSKKDEIRQKGKVTRKLWVAACFEKGCDQRGIADGTNATYRTFFGGKTAKQLRDERGMRKHESLRDDMRPSTLAALSLTEALAAEHIAEMVEYGNTPCVQATTSCAETVKGAVLQARAARKTIEIV